MSRRQIHVATEPDYEVSVGTGLLSEVEALVRGFSGCAILSDTNVEPLYASRLTGLEGAPRKVVAAGEDSKSFETLEDVLEFLSNSGLDRGSCLVALGGGVVGDLAGLAASLFMRGIAFVQCPTTLLAQVDASVGGKTAVNLRSGKNLAGTFHQPAAVFADVTTLASLAQEEYASGLGEVVKTALIGGEPLLKLLESEHEAILARKPDVLIEVVEHCVRIKAGIVAEDEREAGRRKCLNLGHTFAHAIEHAAGYGAVPHGVAVACGLALAVRFSAEQGLLADQALVERSLGLLERLGLPTTLAALGRKAELDSAALLHGMRHDKKGPSGEARLVLPRAVGQIEVDVRADSAALEHFLARA